MTAQEKDRIECAIRHIKTAVDVDPWAVEIAVQAMERLKEQKTFSEMVHLHDTETHDKRTETHACDSISRQAAIDALMDEFKRVPTTAIRAKNRIDRLPSAQPNLQPTCNQLATVAKDKNVPCKDTISRQDAIDAIVNTVSEIGLHDNSEVARYGATFRQHEIIDIIEGMPSTQLDVPEINDGDMISRQAAIDAFYQYLNINWTTLDVLKKINDLPPAQPETCEGCKHLGKWENEVEYGYPSPCTRCKRRVEDHYER